MPKYYSYPLWITKYMQRSGLSYFHNLVYREGFNNCPRSDLQTTNSTRALPQQAIVQGYISDRGGKTVKHLIPPRSLLGGATNVHPGLVLKEGKGAVRREEGRLINQLSLVILDGLDCHLSARLFHLHLFCRDGLPSRTNIWSASESTKEVRYRN